MVKLMDYAENIDSLLNQTNPFAIITAAHLKTKAPKNNPEERYTWKWTITRALYEKGFSTKDIENFRKTQEELTAQDPA
jgi:SOS response regulatory protein OraA/RecX